MENLSENMSQILRKCKMLEDYVSLHLRRQSIIPKIQELKTEAENTEDTQNESRKILEVENTAALQKYKNLIIRMRNQQSIILKLIETVQERKKEVMIQIHSVKKPSHLNLMTPLAVKLFKNHNTPKMCYSDYENSPFVTSQMRPMSLQFFDFNARITAEMFNEVPKYMRGRETLDGLLNFVDNILIPCFVEKYQLMGKKRELIKPNELQVWNMFREQKSLFPNQKFITQTDLTRKLNKLIDKKLQAKITMLRHLSIICEQRKSSTICYIWSSN